MLALAGVLGPSLQTVMLAVGIVYVPTFARVIRSRALQVREMEFITAARAIGTGQMTIVVAHILPNIAGPIIVLSTIQIAISILAESALSFLGLGVPPPTPTWGSMINEARIHMGIAPWAVFAPGGAIFVAVLGFNLLGDGIRDILDPRISSQR
jgi:peptide/nickel transport system permease protein